MSQGISPGGTNGHCDSEARRQIAEVRHELRSFQAVTEIKGDTLQREFTRTSDEVKERTISNAAEVKKNVEESAATIKRDFNAKHAELTTNLSRIESLLKWAGSLIITLILGVLGWSLVQQINSNQQQQKDLESKIRLLEQQERTSRLQQSDQRILPLSAAETALSADRGGQ